MKTFFKVLASILLFLVGIILMVLGVLYSFSLFLMSGALLSGILNLAFYLFAFVAVIACITGLWNKRAKRKFFYAAGVMLLLSLIFSCIPNFNF